MQGLVQGHGTSTSGSTTPTNAYTSSLTAGNFLLAWVTWDNAATAAAVLSKSAGTATVSAWTALGSPSNSQGAAAGAGSSTTMGQFYWASVTTGGTYTLKVTEGTGGAGSVGMIISEWSSAAIASVLDIGPTNSHSANPSGGGVQSMAALPGCAAGDLVVGGWSNDGTPGAGTAFNTGSWLDGTASTDHRLTDNDATGEPVSMVYQAGVAAGSYTPQIALPASETGASCYAAVSLKAPAGGAVDPYPADFPLYRLFPGLWT